MLFNSVTYLCYLAAIVPSYWLLPKKAKPWLVLVASLIFYGFWSVKFLLLIALSSLVDFLISLKIDKEQNYIIRKLWLLTSLASNIGILAYFKYAYFIVDNISSVGKLLGMNWTFSVGEIILPLGISFYTFLSISYTVDVYRKQFVPTKNYWIYLIYVMFWPHMIAGPILRASELVPQFLKNPNFNFSNITNGIKKIVVGLFLKAVLADQIAPWVDDAFATPGKNLGGIDVWTMAFGFGLQIYFDFAGYSLIAIGSALLLGVKFPINFNWPYLASSPREFWKRWHITLSAWVRDYLYLPLCGANLQNCSGGGIDIQMSSKKKNWLRFAFSLLATWFIMGLWHGANWKFALWGVWHASIIFIYRAVKKCSPSNASWSTNLVGWMLTLPIVMLGWIPFRANSLKDSLIFLSRTLDFSSYKTLGFRENFYLIVFSLMCGMISIWIITHFRNRFRIKPWIWQIGETIALGLMIFAVFIFLRPVKTFIYFQF